MLGPGHCLWTAPHTKTLLRQHCSAVASAYLIIKLVHGHWGHGVAVGLCPIPMAVRRVNPVAGFRVELRAVLGAAVLTGGHHIHRRGPWRDPSRVRWWVRWWLTVYSPFFQLKKRVKTVTFTCCLAHALDLILPPVHLSFTVKNNNGMKLLQFGGLNMYLAATFCQRMVHPGSWCGWSVQRAQVLEFPGHLAEWGAE